MYSKAKNQEKLLLESYVHAQLFSVSEYQWIDNRRETIADFQ